MKACQVREAIGAKLARQLTNTVKEASGFWAMCTEAEPGYAASRGSSDPANEAAFQRVLARWRAIGSANKQIGLHRAFTIVWLTDTVEQAVAMATSSADRPTADELQASYTAACEAHMKTMGLSPADKMQRVAYRKIDKRFRGSGSAGAIHPAIPQIEFMVGRAQEESA